MDDLIKRLRNRRICIQQSGSLDDFPLLAEAADAIEELSKRNPHTRNGGRRYRNCAMVLLILQENGVIV